MKDQNTQLSENSQDLHVKVATVQTITPQPGWAIAAARPDASTMAESNIPNIRADKEEEEEKTYVRIRTAPQTMAHVSTEDVTTFGRHISSDEANERTGDALNQDTMTENAEIAGIGSTKTGYSVRFRVENLPKLLEGAHNG